MKFFNKFPFVPHKIYHLNKENLNYEEVPFGRLFMTLFVIIAITFICGVYYGVGFERKVITEKEVVKEEFNIDNHTYTKTDLYPIKNKVWLDSTFKDYEKRAKLYLGRPRFSGSPMTAEMMTLCARNAYDSTGILVPVELALAQAQWESSFGREGKSPVNNPYNVGEYDSGTVIWFNSTQEGIQAYYYLMTENYLSCRSVEELLFNFVNCGGYRYASGDYEIHVGNQYYYIKKWLNETLGVN
jgi:hypothetical protein